MEFIIAALSVIVIMLMSVYLLRQTNKMYRRDYMNDLERGEILQERCIDDDYKKALDMLEDDKSKMNFLRRMSKQHLRPSRKHEQTMLLHNLAHIHTRTSMKVPTPHNILISNLSEHSSENNFDDVLPKNGLTQPLLGCSTSNYSRSSTMKVKKKKVYKDEKHHYGSANKHHQESATLHHGHNGHHGHHGLTLQIPGLPLQKSSSHHHLET